MLIDDGEDQRKQAQAVDETAARKRREIVKAYYYKNREAILESRRKPGRFEECDKETSEKPIFHLDEKELWRRIIERRKHRYDEDSDYYKELNGLASGRRSE